MISEQLTIDGTPTFLVPDGVMKVTRRVMHEKPVTYRSHRLLMIEIAKAWGFDWNGLEGEQRYILERLFDVSPDIERSARKVRDEDATLASIGNRDSDAPETPLNIENDTSYDAFVDIDNEMKRKEAQRRQWRR